MDKFLVARFLSVISLGQDGNQYHLSWIPMLNRALPETSDQYNIFQYSIILHTVQQYLELKHNKSLRY